MGFFLLEEQLRLASATVPSLRYSGSTGQGSRLLRGAPSSLVAESFIKSFSIDSIALLRQTSSYPCGLQHGLRTTSFECQWSNWSPPQIKFRTGRPPCLYTDIPGGPFKLFFVFFFIFLHIRHFQPQALVLTPLPPPGGDPDLSRSDVGLDHEVAKNSRPTASLGWKEGKGSRWGQDNDPSKPLFEVNRRSRCSKKHFQISHILVCFQSHSKIQCQIHFPLRTYQRIGPPGHVWLAMRTINVETSKILNHKWGWGASHRLEKRFFYLLLFPPWNPRNLS